VTVVLLELTGTTGLKHLR